MIRVTVTHIEALLVRLHNGRQVCVVSQVSLYVVTQKHYHDARATLSCARTTARTEHTHTNKHDPSTRAVSFSHTATRTLLHAHTHTRTQTRTRGHTRSLALLPAMNAHTKTTYRPTLNHVRPHTHTHSRMQTPHAHLHLHSHKDTLSRTHTHSRTPLSTRTHMQTVMHKSISEYKTAYTCTQIGRAHV